ncbi:(2Fe-2S) ferredoxin domain-containing protein [Sphingomonas ginsenosidivorax]|uniref:(2Fe-2S) ferredoxin domain-containing protein n=1 Tax=Sphingomonas ginsenosidivorax TaxID=862135 RepID=A0A5C6UDL1_9SPHN|nr:(2Fe-2S) ferredoxin domain-containing protein [Sphingomonas ginsenosidivorax]TXC70802.1 (2Fe-2S) ferredoxin domain-containing protein [Sphingomonas ginsenosidivorax]
MIRPVRAGWAGAVLVCGKCSKKLDGGFGKGGRVSLAKALRKDLGLKKGRKAALGVVETKCLGVCPKNAVMVVDSAQPDRWLVVPAGADLDEVEAAVFASVPPPG